MLRIFIGYDSREPIAYHVCAHSILSRASQPVSITPLTLQSVKDVYHKPRGPLEATEFSMTRFLVPYLCDYKGTAIFMDADMLARADIHDVPLEKLESHNGGFTYTDTVGELQKPSICAAFALSESPAVWCCQHNYTPKSVSKMDGQQQTVYPRKNWSSFMVFNNEQCRALTPEYVNKATGMMLHRFWWVEDDSQIGSLPLEWNWLVGEYDKNPDAKILHYTNGLPIFPGYEDCDHADLWFAERDAMLGQAVTA